MKSYWIWSYGDFEVYHSNLVNSRRQEYGVAVPVFWKYYDVDKNVVLWSDVKTERDGYIRLHLLGDGYIMIADKRYGTGIDIPLPKGEYKLKVCVLNMQSLPAAYIESDVVASDGTWYTYDAEHEKVPVGFLPEYSSPKDTPDNFKFSYEKKISESESVNGGTHA